MLDILRYYVWTYEESYRTLEEFSDAMNSSLILVLQENPEFLGTVVSELISDFNAFFYSNFGYNRLILSKQVTKSLKELDKLTPPGNISKIDNICISRNKNILFFLLREATMDWSCLKNQVISASRTLMNIVDKALQLKDIPSSECNLGILCLLTKGFSGAALGATLSANLIDLGLTVFDFFSAVRRCQKNIDPLTSAYDSSLENIKYCLSVK